jgi:hypothetical protein
VLGDARDGCQREVRRAEAQIVVSALEGAFLPHRQSGAIEGLSRRGGGEVFQPIGQSPGMGASADAFSVRIKRIPFA